MYLGGMTKPVQPRVLVGGPLDGQTFKAVSRWPSYLDANGEILSSRVGDRIMRGSSKIANHCYAAAGKEYRWTGKRDG